MVIIIAFGSFLGWKYLLSLKNLGSISPNTPLTSVDIRSQLLAQPPARVRQLANKNDDIVNVDFLKADLDASGRFQFVVAFYSLQNDSQGVYLRVFRQQGSQLLFVGDQEDQHAHGGFGATVSLVDINGDGIPEIDVSGHQANGEQIFHEYFTWTGSSLHLSIAAIADPELEDLDGDGVLEIVAPNGDGTFNIYKYNDMNFVLLRTSDHDPG